MEAKGVAGCPHLTLLDLAHLKADLTAIFPALMAQHKALVAGPSRGALFVSLDVRPPHQKLAPQRVLVAASVEDLFGSRAHGAKLVLNFETLEVYCFGCEVELLDELLARRSAARQRPLVEVKEHLVELLRRFSRHHGGDALDGPRFFAQAGLHLLVGTSLANSFAAVLYTLWGLEYVRTVAAPHQILKRVYVLELESLHRTGLLLTSRYVSLTSIVFKVARVVYYLDSPRFAPRYFLDAWVAVAKKSQAFFTHGFIEFNQLLESVVYLLHEALNFSDSADPMVALTDQVPRPAGGHTRSPSLRSRASLAALVPKRLASAPRKRVLAK